MPLASDRPLHRAFQVGLDLHDAVRRFDGDRLVSKGSRSRRLSLSSAWADFDRASDWASTPARRSLAWQTLSLGRCRSTRPGRSGRIRRGCLRRRHPTRALPRRSTSGAAGPGESRPRHAVPRPWPSPEFESTAVARGRGRPRSRPSRGRQRRAAWYVGIRTDSPGRGGAPRFRDFRDPRRRQSGLFFPRLEALGQRRLGTKIDPQRQMAPVLTRAATPSPARRGCGLGRRWPRTWRNSAGSTPDRPGASPSG